MILSRYYDMALWAILSGAKREEILDFVERIPEPLLKQIQKTLILYQYYLNEKKNFKDEKELQLSGKFKTAGDMLYWYSLDITTGALDIGESVSDGELSYDIFQMTLYPLKRNYYMDMDSFDEISLGDISYNYAEDYVSNDLMIFVCDTMDFSLVKFPFGKMMLCSHKKLSYDKKNGSGKKRYNFINFRNISSDYNISNLRDKNRLVRRRKKNSR